MRQKGTAERAETGEEGTTYRVHGTSEDAGDSAPAGSLRWWNVERQRTGVPEEDAPHLGAAQLNVHCLADSIPGRGERFHRIRNWQARELPVFMHLSPKKSASGRGSKFQQKCEI